MLNSLLIPCLHLPNVAANLIATMRAPCSQFSWSLTAASWMLVWKLTQSGRDTHQDTDNLKKPLAFTCISVHKAVAFLMTLPKPGHYNVFQSRACPLCKVITPITNAWGA